MGQESKLQNRILADVKARRLAGQPIWFQKISDRFTAGIPDLLGVIAGRFVACELKAKGEQPTCLQAMVLAKIQTAGGNAEVIDDFSQWTQLVEDFLAREDV